MSVAPMQPLTPGLVSIVMPAYNCAKYIAQSIDSVLAQSYSNWELIIVEDCSTDNTLEILRQYEQRGDERIKIVRNERNMGAARTRNVALRTGRGQWVAFLDSDDVWTPEKLSTQTAFMEKNGVHFSFTDYEHMDMDGNLQHVRVSGPNHITKRSFFRYCWVGCLTVMYDARVIGLLQVPALENREDYALWLKAVKKADCYRIPEVLAFYRRGHGVTLSSGGWRRLVKHHYRMFRISELQSPPHAVVSTLRNLVFGFLKKAFYVRSYR